MAEIKEKRPSWFKMKIERRKLIKDLPPETAVNVLLDCWDYLETMEDPQNLTAMEKIAFSAFFPNMEEAWAKYEQRVKNGAQAEDRQNKTVWFRMVSNDTAWDRRNRIGR